MKEKGNIGKISLVIGNDQYILVGKPLKNVRTFNSCAVPEIKAKINDRTKKPDR